MVVYHGTASDISIFDVAKAGTVNNSDWGPGVYFTPSEWQAKFYSEDARKKADSEGEKLWNEYELKAKELGTTPMNAAIDLGYGSDEYKELNKYHERWIKRRKQIEQEPSTVVAAYLKIETPYNYTANSMTDPFLAERAKSKGCDGIIIRRGDGSIDEIVVFSPTQIKSINNQGTFDP